MNRAQLRLLVVDDEPENIRYVQRVLEREGYGSIHTTTDPREAPALFDRVRPDLVLMDLLMPHMEGVEVIGVLSQRVAADDWVPFLMLTSDTSREAKRRALDGGAHDFLTKPFSPEEIRLRIRNLLRTRDLHRQVRDQRALLERRVSERTRDLEDARLEMLNRLARAAEFRDDQTGRHTGRVGQLTTRLALELGVPAAEAELMGRAAQLHDVGKIGIPDAILLKPGRLTPQELSVMEGHTRIGALILSGSHSRLLRLAEEIALSHHEWWDGSGYPRGLRGKAIPLSGRVVTVADVLDSLTHRRHYKAAWSVERTLSYIREQSGRQFDPGVVEALGRLEAEGALVLDPEIEEPPERPAFGTTASLATPAATATAAGAATLHAGHDPGANGTPADPHAALRAERDTLMRRLREVERTLAEEVSLAADGGPALARNGRRAPHPMHD